MKCPKCESEQLVAERSSGYHGWRCTNCHEWCYGTQVEEGELLPCILCGRVPASVQQDHGIGNHLVNCGCGIQVEIGRLGPNYRMKQRQEAEETWNLLMRIRGGKP